MKKTAKQDSQRMAGRINILENIFVVALAFYPLRHIGWGLDLWDTGYNYANFQYMGTEHMDPMWLFSTYLATAVGNLLTRLPNGGTLYGMNLYTGLFGSALALAGYFFCTRGLKIPRVIAFAGEFIAVSLYWCPTAVLYNYLTYVLFLGCTILLYYGLTKEKKACLIAAGVCLGANVLTRFSNLPEAAMIVAVWAYDVLLWLEERKRGKLPREGLKTGGTERVAEAFPEIGGAEGAGFWRRLSAHTGWCLCGYAAALAALFGWIQLRYGLGEYIKGISRLFAMTDNAADYRPAAMLTGMVDTYVKNLYWAVRIGVILAGGMALFAAAGLLEGLLERAARILHLAVRLLWLAVGAAMLWWLYMRGFCTLEFYSYASMLRPGVLFLMLTLVICAVNILRRGSLKEEKLISGMLILILLLTPLGSNNALYPAMNNLCVAAPYTLWQSWRFIRNVKDKKITRYLILSPFPAKVILAAFLAMCLFQFGGFGAGFAFAEATGIQDVSARVENNGILKNIRMSPQKAQWMTEIKEHIEEGGLQGKEVILYGDIPGLSYYLQMPSAFNPWSSLSSYSAAAMEEALAGIREDETPVVIVDQKYALYLEGGAAALEAAGMDKERRAALTEDKKLLLLKDFMEKREYQKTFDNGKFAVYRGCFL